MSHQLTISEAMAKSLELTSSSASLDVELLLCHVLDCERAYLRTWPDKSLDQDQTEHFLSLVSQRQKGRPIAHLIGQRDFWTLNLKVNEHTLIPRPDTEVLVERALNLPLDKSAISVLDLGTGTGAIALALASERPAWQVNGVDRFPKVIELARQNANLNSLPHVEFFCSDWFSAFREQRFSLIVSNPPYIDAKDKHLGEGDVRFEPASALIAEDQGMADIKKITHDAREFLEAGGWLLFEHGYDQAELVRSVLKKAGYQQVETSKDYGGNDRVTQGQWTG